MSLEQWAYLGEIVASAAVVASLVYLAIQVRQSNRLAQAQTRQIMMQLVQQELYKVVDDPAIFSLWVKEPISTEEKSKLHAWLIANIRQREYEWLEYKNGTIDPGMFESYAGITAVILGTERTRRWWGVHGHSHSFHPGFVDFVDQLLEKSPLVDYFDSLDKW